jgi:plasmid stabilization system protein ParE
MNIQLHPEAAKEVAEAVRWYEEQQPGLGQIFASDAEAAIYRLAEFPYLNPEIKKGIRRAIIPVFPYGIIYSIHEENIEVYAVAHLHRRPFYWKKRIK